MDMERRNVYQRVRTLGHLYAMPEVPSVPRCFGSKAEQMRHWLSDPILYADAVAWFTHQGWVPVLGSYGEPIDFISPARAERGLEEFEADVE